MNIGKNMDRALRFILKYPGWHSYNTRQYTTVQAIKSLERQGFVKINRFHQFRARDIRLTMGVN